jgi:hypothetical protein
MHNIYIHEKSQKSQKQAEETLKKQQKLKTQSQKTRNLLSKKYKQRINSLLNDLPKSLKARPSRLQTPKIQNFYTNYTPEKQRIESSETKNKWLDPVPFERPSYNLRSRDKSKELSSDLHFKSFFSEKRVKSSKRVYSEKLLISGKTFESFIKLGMISHDFS